MFIRFNPYYALPAYITDEEGPVFPFNEGEHVSMALVFAFAMPVSEHRREEDDLKTLDVEFEGIFYPDGRESDDDRICQVRSLQEAGQVHQLRLPIGEENLLQSVITPTDQTRRFPFQPGQVVIAPLVVERVKRETRVSLSTHATWTALLSPFGNEDQGLIVSEVELAQNPG